MRFTLHSYGLEVEGQVLPFEHLWSGYRLMGWAQDEGSPITDAIDIVPPSRIQHSVWKRVRTWLYNHLWPLGKRVHLPAWSRTAVVQACHFTDGFEISHDDDATVETATFVTDCIIEAREPVLQRAGAPD